MSMNMNNNNNNAETKNVIMGVNDNSFMHECYLGSLARVTGYHIEKFLEGFIKDLRGEVGMIYSQDPQTGEVQGMLAIPYKANSQNRQQTNMNGMIPIPGINSSRNGKINENVLKSIDRIKMNGYGPSIMYKEDAILFRIDFGLLIAEMMNPQKGYVVSIDDIKMNGMSDVVCVVSVFKSKNGNSMNRMTRVLQGQKFTNRPQNNQQQPQRYNGNRR